MAIEHLRDHPRGPRAASREAKEFAQKFIVDPGYRENLRLRIMCGEAPAMEKLLWYYACGRPAVTVEVTPDAGVVEKIVREIVDPQPQDEPLGTRADHEVNDSIH